MKKRGGDKFQGCGSVPAADNPGNLFSRGYPCQRKAEGSFFGTRNHAKGSPCTESGRAPVLLKGGQKYHTECGIEAVDSASITGQNNKACENFSPKNPSLHGGGQGCWGETVKSLKKKRNK